MKKYVFIRAVALDDKISAITSKTLILASFEANRADTLNCTFLWIESPPRASQINRAQPKTDTKYNEFKRRKMISFLGNKT